MGPKQRNFLLDPMLLHGLVDPGVQLMARTAAASAAGSHVYSSRADGDKWRKMFGFLCNDQSASVKGRGHTLASVCFIAANTDKAFIGTVSQTFLSCHSPTGTRKLTKATPVATCCLRIKEKILAFDSPSSRVQRYASTLKF